MFYSSQRWNWTWSRNHSPHSLEPGLNYVWNFKPSLIVGCTPYESPKVIKSDLSRFLRSSSFSASKIFCKDSGSCRFCRFLCTAKIWTSNLSCNLLSNSIFHFPLYQLFAVITSRVFVRWFFAANVSKPGSTKAASGLQLLTEKCVQHKTVSMQRCKDIYMAVRKQCWDSLLQSIHVSGPLLDVVLLPRLVGGNQPTPLQRRLRTGPLLWLCFVSSNVSGKHEEQYKFLGMNRN